jgi:hypothetical protein
MRQRARVLGWFGLVSLGAFCALSACGGRSGAEFDDSSDDTGGAGGSSGRGGSSSTGGSGRAGGGPATGGASGGRGGGTSTGGASSSGGAVSTGGFAGFGGFAGNGGSSAGFGGFGGSTGACVECITSSCPAAQECLGDPACIEGAICGATSCLDQGSAVGCWLGCFGGDVQKALAAYSAVTCVIEGCGMQCTDAFGP